MFNFGQQFFIDFQTGTTVDDIYAVNGVSHKFTQGSYVTSIKFIPMMKLFTRFVIILSIVGLCYALLKDSWFLSIVLLITILQNLSSKDWR